MTVLRGTAPTFVAASALVGTVAAVVVAAAMVLGPPAVDARSPAPSPGSSPFDGTTITALGGFPGEDVPIMPLTVTSVVRDVECDGSVLARTTWTVVAVVSSPHAVPFARKLLADAGFADRTRSLGGAALSSEKVFIFTSPGYLVELSVAHRRGSDRTLTYRVARASKDHDADAECAPPPPGRTALTG